MPHAGGACRRTATRQGRRALLLLLLLLLLRRRRRDGAPAFGRDAARDSCRWRWRCTSTRGVGIRGSVLLREQRLQAGATASSFSAALRLVAVKDGHEAALMLGGIARCRDRRLVTRVWRGGGERASQRQHAKPIATN